jgi:hypothetical protein
MHSISVLHDENIQGVLQAARRLVRFRGCLKKAAVNLILGAGQQGLCQMDYLSHVRCLKLSNLQHLRAKILVVGLLESFICFVTINFWLLIFFLLQSTSFQLCFQFYFISLILLTMLHLGMV